jgi:glycosyltransferase involved in cell wall biosynthesis
MLLAAFDIFVHPTRMDPAPLAVLEACASALPVVAYEEGGVCEFVENGRTGLLTPPENIDGLARSMYSLLENPGRAKEMGAASRTRIGTHFRPEDSGATFATLLGNVLP